MGQPATSHRVTDQTVRGRVDFAGRTAQATPADVVNAATVSFIDASSNQTVVTTKTDAAGSFTLSLGSFTPVHNACYLLEAVKGLNNQAPGSDAARFRTILQWNGTGWLSCTNASVPGSIVINALTTALAIETALDAVNVPITGTIGKVNISGSPATLNANPTYTNHSDSEIQQLATDLLSYLGSDTDPVASVPAIAPSIASFTPTTASPNSLVRILGSGFSPTVSGNTVSFNGANAQVLLATPTNLVVVVPNGASTGPLRVQTGRGLATGSAFTVSTSATGLAISGFAPTYGRADTVVTLTGAFGSGTATPSVTFLGVGSSALKAQVSAWSATNMTVAVPLGALPGPISVQSGGAAATSNADFDVWQGDLSLMSQLNDTAAGGPYQLPQGLSHHTVIQVGNYIYTLGNYAGGILYPDCFMLPIRPDGSLGQARRVSSFNAGRTAVAAFAMNNFLFAMGGTQIDRAAINSDGTLGPWVTLPTVMPVARSGIPALVSGSNVYLVSGSLTDSTIDRWTVDGAGNITRAATYPLTVGGTPVKTTWYGGTVVGSALVLVGGTYDTGANYSNKTIRLPIAGDGSIGGGAFSAYTLPMTLYAPGGTVQVGGNLYVWGGYDVSTLYNSNVYHAPIDTTTGALTGAWVADPSLPATSSIIVSGGQVTASGKRLWTIGGFDNAAVTATIQTTTINTDGSLQPWSIYGGMTNWRYGHNTLVLNDKLWIVGSQQNTNKATEYFQIQANGTLGPSTVGPSTVVPRYKAVAVDISRGGNRYVYLLGGRDYSTGGNVTTVERAMVNPDGTLGFFAPQSTQLNQPRAWGSGAVIGDYVYMFGGNTGSAYLNSIERAPINADGSLGPFEVYGRPLPLALGDGSVVVAGKYVYLIGCAGGGSPIEAVYMAPILPDGSIGAFSRGPSLVTGTYEGTGFRLGNYLYYLGGWVSGAQQSVSQRALLNPDGSINAWQVYKTERYALPYATSYISTPGIYQDYLYMFGGYQGITNNPIKAIAHGTFR